MMEVNTLAWLEQRLEQGDHITMDQDFTGALPGGAFHQVRLFPQDGRGDWICGIGKTLVEAIGHLAVALDERERSA